MPPLLLADPLLPPQARAVAPMRGRPASGQGPAGWGDLKGPRERDWWGHRGPGVGGKMVRFTISYQEKIWKKNWTIKHLVILSIKHGGLDLQNWWLRDWFKLRSRLGRNSSRTASYFGVSYRMDKEHKLRTRVGLSQINSGIQKIRPHVGRMFWSWITMFSFDDKCPQIPKFLPLY